MAHEGTGEQAPNQGLSLATLRALADGTLLAELGEVSTQIMASLEASVELARAMQGNNHQAIVDALKQVADEGSKLPDLESLKQALELKDTALGNHALTLAGIRARAPIEGELQGFIDNEQVAAEQRPQRKENLDKALSIATPFIENLSDKKTETYMEKSGRRFTWKGDIYGHEAHPDLYFIQYPFITLENGQELTIREVYGVDYRHRKNPNDSGFQLIVRTSKDEIPSRVDIRYLEGYYWQVYATFKTGDPSISYSQDAINNDIFRALLADKEMLEKLPEIVAALKKELKNPKVTKSDEEEDEG